MNLQENIRRILWEETEQTNKSYTLYVDMGGVLFKKMGADEGGSGDENKWEIGGEELWNGIKKYNPTILSATGYDPDPKKQAAKRDAKRDQVKKYLGTHVPIVFVTLGKDKATYANSNSILIDDSQPNINSWKDKRGIGIKHDPNDIQNTLAQLSSEELYGY